MKKEFVPLLTAVLVTLATFLWVSPFYEYPVGDAWSYARVTKHFLETGTFQILPWYGQSLIAQILWASLFCLPLGFSFSALHLSSAVTGVLAILFFDLFLKELAFSKKERLWGMLLLLACWPFIHLSRSFHTDLPFLACYLGAAWAYARGFSRRSTGWLLFGSLFLGVSVLIRQVGIFLPFALLFAFSRNRGRWGRSEKMIPLIPFGVLAGFTVWQHSYFRGVAPANLLLAADALRIDQVLADAMRIPFFGLLYFGYYASPVLIPSAAGLFREKRTDPLRWRLFLLGWLLAGATVLALGLGRGLWMPDCLPRGFHLQGAAFPFYLFVILCAVTGAAAFFAFWYPSLAGRLPAGRLGWPWAVLFGAAVVLALPPVRTVLLASGERLLHVVYPFFSERLHLYQSLAVWEERLPVLYHRAIAHLFGWAALGGFFFWVLPSRLPSRGEGGSVQPMSEFEKVFHGASVLYLLFLLFLPVTTDRYLFPVFPSFILLTLRAGRRARFSGTLGPLLLAGVLFLSLAHTDRVIRRVGALWEGGKGLLRQGVPAEVIDAGFVFNGWHLYEKRQREGFEGTDRGWRETGWWVRNPRYRVSARVAPGDDALRRIPYRDLLTPGENAVYVSRRGPR